MQKIQKGKMDLYIISQFTADPPAGHALRGALWGNVINLREKMAICTVNTIFSFSHPFYCCHFAQSNKILYVYILYKNTSMHL